MENKELAEIRKLYNEAIDVWPEDDLWHIQTNKFICKKVLEILKPICNDASIILNAGSGGTDYNLPGVIYDCDIAEKKIAKCKRPICASIESLPIDNDFFDIIICVGSVINYCDASLAISELTRALKPNGILLLEFERSNSAEFLLTSEYGKSVFQKIYKYNKQTHKLWMYSEKYIESLLKGNKMHISRKTRFHSFSSLVYRLTYNDDLSSSYIKYDNLLKPLSYYFAHNIIMVCSKK